MDWTEIKTQYITRPDGESAKAFSDRLGVHYKQLLSKKESGGWEELRQEYLDDLTKRKLAKHLEAAVEQYHLVSTKNLAIAQKLQYLIDMKINEAIESQGEDIRSSDFVNYTSAVKSIAEILERTNDIAYATSILVQAGLVTKAQVKGIQAAVAAGEAQTRVMLAASFETN